jgi:chaperonin GroES
MFEKFRPLGDRALIKRIEAEETTASGIIIPDAAKEKAQTGTVIAVGPGKRSGNGSSLAMSINVGDTVYFGKYSGTETDDQHIIIREEEILGVVEK